MSKLSNTTCCVVGEVIIRDKAALFGFMTAGTQWPLCLGPALSTAAKYLKLIILVTVVMRLAALQQQ